MQGRHLGRLVNHGVAGRQARGGLPEGDLDRVVPGPDARAHAERFLGRVDPGRVAEAERLAVQAARRDQVGKVLEHVGARYDVDRGRLGEWFASVEGLDFGEFVVSRSKYLYGLVEDACSFNGWRAGP